MIIAKIIVQKGKSDGRVQILEPPIGVIGDYKAKDIGIDYAGMRIRFNSSFTVNDEEEETHVFETEVQLSYDLLEYDEEVMA